MMTPELLLPTIVLGLNQMPEKYRSRDAAAMILAICCQEQGLGGGEFASRQQLVMRSGKKRAVGPAKGWCQFERAGIAALLTHTATSYQLHLQAESRGYPRGGAQLHWYRDTLHNAVKFDDVLMTQLARLNLWWHPGRLPCFMHIDGIELNAAQREYGWGYYLKTWGPGKPHKRRWAHAWRKAQRLTERLAHNSDGTLELRPF